MKKSPKWMGNDNSNAQNGPSSLQRKHSKVLDLSQLFMDWAEQEISGLVRMLVITGTSSQPFLRSIKRKGSQIDCLHATYNTIGKKESPLNSFRHSVFLVSYSKAQHHRGYTHCGIFLFSSENQLQRVHYWQPGLETKPSLHHHDVSLGIWRGNWWAKPANLLFSKKMPAEPPSLYLNNGPGAAVSLWNTF